MARKSKSQTTDGGVTITLGGNHQYTVKGDHNVAPGRIPGVTSVIREANGSSLEPLMRWSQDIIQNSARSNFLRTPYQGLTPWGDFVNNMMDVAAKEPDLSRDLGGAYGTQVHEQIENRNPLLPESKAAVAFMEAENIKTVATEFYVYSAEHTYAGSIDLLGQVEGSDELLILDWKTGYVDDGCALQIGAYCMAFKEMYPDLKTSGAIIKLVCDAETGINGYEVMPVNLEYAQAQFLDARKLYARRREDEEVESDGGKKRRQRKSLWT